MTNIKEFSEYLILESITEIKISINLYLTRCCVDLYIQYYITTVYSPWICTCNVLSSTVLGYASHLKNTWQGVYSHFDWPVIPWSPQVTYVLAFPVSVKGTINYVNADIYWFKYMI